MGKAMAVFGLWMIVCALALTYQDVVSSLAPEVSLSNAIFNSNALSPYLSKSSANVTTFNNTLGNTLPQSSPTGTSSSSSNYPDWTNSVFSWVGIFTAPIDFIGTPYFLLMWMFPGSDAAIWGALLSIVNLVLIVGWFTGRID